MKSIPQVGSPDWNALFLVTTLQISLRVGNSRRIKKLKGLGRFVREDIFQKTLVS